MNNRTEKLIGEFNAIPWFSNSGKMIGGNFMIVENWKTAIEFSQSEIWRSVRLQVSNRFAREVRRISYERSLEWNAVAAKLRKEIGVLSDRICEPFSTEFHLGTKLQSAVSWDLLMICLETEYLDLAPPLFSVPRLLPIYQSGHFPCGWDGPKTEEGLNCDLKDWRLWVY